MANAILWQAAWNSRGNVLTTELNNLGNGSRSVASSAIDNSVNLDQYGCLDVTLASLTPTGTPSLSIYMISSADGTNYSEGSDTIDPGADTIIAIVPLRAAAGTVRKVTAPFRLPPGKIKFLLKNDSGVTLGASGNVVALYTGNDEVQ